MTIKLLIKSFQKVIFNGRSRIIKRGVTDSDQLYIDAYYFSAKLIIFGNNLPAIMSTFFIMEEQTSKKKPIESEVQKRQWLYNSLTSSFFVNSLTSLTQFARLPLVQFTYPS